MKHLTLPLTTEQIKDLKAGDSVYLTGVILTARDCAHKRIVNIIKEGTELPFTIQDSTIYYAGPCPTKPGKSSGSCGPTTSARMDSFAPILLDSGLRCIIGKGEMSQEVAQSLISNQAVYFAAVGGAGALYGNAIKSNQCIAFEDLLSEAVYRLEVVDFPVIVAMDCHGGNIYQ